MINRYRGTLWGGGGRTSGKYREAPSGEGYRPTETGGTGGGELSTALLAERGGRDCPSVENITRALNIVKIYEECFPCQPREKEKGVLDV